MSILNKITRELAKQRTVSLYKDQAEEIARLDKMGVKVQYTDLVRIGVDLALKQLKEELEQHK